MKDDMSLAAPFGGARIAGKMAAAGLVTAGLLLVPRPSRAADQVDTATVLQIGPLRISSYAVEKNFRRAFGCGPGEVPAAGADSVSRWFETFLSQQVLIAEALQEGIFSDPKVVEATDRMTDYMLASPDGPEFAADFKRMAPSDAELAVLKQKSRRRTEVVLALFADPESARRILGADFVGISVPQRMARLAACEGNPDITYYRGPINWPFVPFGEFGPYLDHIDRGQWLLGCEGLTGVIYGYCLGLVAEPRVEEVFGDGEFRKFVESSRRLQFQREHRASLLKKSSLLVEPAIFQKVCDTLETNPLADGKIDASRLTNELGHDFLSYLGPMGARHITVNAFLTEYNARFIRHSGDAAQVLSEACRDFPVEEWDRDEARAAGIDHTERFREDRANFTRYQALELFRCRRMAPAISISSERVREIYEATKEEHGGALCCILRIASFGDRKSANAFAGEATENPFGTAKSSAWQEEPIALGGVIPWGGFPSEYVLGMKENTMLGVFQSREKFTVVVRGRTLKTGSYPLSYRANGIRSQLQREDLDRAEITWARRYSSAFVIVDRIPYGDYHVSHHRSPWPQ